MKEKFNFYLVIPIFVLVSAVSIWFLIPSEDKTLINEANKFIGKDFPQTHSLDIATKKLYFDEIGKDKTITLIYLDKNCEVCKAEVKTIAENNLPTNNIFGVMNEDESVIKSYIKEHNINFPVFQDVNGKFLTSLENLYFPMNLKIKNGVIKKVLFGFPQDKVKFEEFIK
jgi:peroxiredoxin